MGTPAYFSLVIIDILEYAFLQISWQFLDQVRSSDIHNPSSLATLNWSILCSFTSNLVAKLVFERLTIM